MFLAFQLSDIITVPFGWLLSVLYETTHNYGVAMILFAVIVALACVTTAIALVSSAASYFSNLSKGRISYSKLVVIICVFIPDVIMWLPNLVYGA